MPTTAALMGRSTGGRQLLLGLRPRSYHVRRYVRGSNDRHRRRCRRNGAEIVSPIVRMRYLLPLLLAALTPPAAAQTATATTTTGVAGTGIANAYGAVTLSTTANAAAPTASSTAPQTATTAGGATTGSTFNTGSASSSASRGSNTSASTTSGVTGAPARSGSAPNWLLCPPTGASGLAAFVTGTDLSCAP